MFSAGNLNGLYALMTFNYKEMVRHQKNNNSYANHIIITSDLDTFHRLYNRIHAAIIRCANYINRNLKKTIET